MAACREGDYHPDSRFYHAKAAHNFQDSLRVPGFTTHLAERTLPPSGPGASKPTLSERNTLDDSKQHSALYWHLCQLEVPSELISGQPWCELFSFKQVITSLQSPVSMAQRPSESPETPSALNNFPDLRAWQHYPRDSMSAQIFSCLLGTITHLQLW